MKCKYFIIIGLLIYTLQINAQDWLKNYVNSYDKQVIIIKDSKYYLRKNDLAKSIFEKEIDKLIKAFEYLLSEDYESAIYWANNVDEEAEPLHCDVLLILIISYAELNDKSYKKYFNKMKKICEPIKCRDVEEFLDNKGLETKTANVVSNIGINFGVGTGEYVTSDIEIVFYEKLSLSFQYGQDFDHFYIEGPDYSSTIGWDEYPQDLYSSGNYENIFNIGLGYNMFSMLTIRFFSGVTRDMEYKNCNSYYGIIGDAGLYSIKKNNGYNLDYSLDCILHLKKGLSFGVVYGNNISFGGKIGYRYTF